MKKEEEMRKIVDEILDGAEKIIDKGELIKRLLSGQQEVYEKGYKKPISFYVLSLINMMNDFQNTSSKTFKFFREKGLFEDRTLDLGGQPRRLLGQEELSEADRDQRMRDLRNMHMNQHRRRGPM